MNNQSAKSSSHENRVQGYLRPANFAFVKGYAELHRISESKAINDAAAALKKCTPPDQLAKILDRNKY